MDIGKVIGTVVATRKDPSLEGTRLLVVQPLDEKHNPIDEPLVAVDILQDAGVGETVYMVTGGDAVGVFTRETDAGRCGDRWHSGFCFSIG